MAREKFKVYVDMRAKPGTGICRYADTLLNFLPGSDPDCETVPWKDSFSSYQGSRISPAKAVCRMLYELFVLPFVLRKAGAAVFHCTKNFGLPVFARCAKVLTVHDVVPLELAEYGGSPPTRFYYYLNYWLSCRGADRILCISEFTRQRLLEHFPGVSAKVRVVHLGCRADREAPSGADAAGRLAALGISRPYILTLGGTEPRKNVLFAADAYLSSPQCRDHDFVIVGDEWPGRPFPERVKNAPEIHRLGKIHEADLRCLYRNAAVFVFPSLYEGFGLPPFEAMAYGVPVIAADASCMPELLRDAALLFSPGDRADFAEKLDRMLHCGDTRTEYITRGSVCAARRPWSETVGQTAAVYRELISERTAR